ncbi:MAG: lysoplasmalogenase [Bacteroidota bacterium]
MKYVPKGSPVLFNALIGLSALLAIYLRQSGSDELFAIAKPTTTILVIILAALWGDRNQPRYYYGLLVALVFCLAGDVLLLEESRFVFGLGAFLLGHSIFAYCFASFKGIFWDKSPLFVLLPFGMAYYVFLYPGLGKMAIPVAVYFVFILFMCWQGLCLYLWRREAAFRAVALGCVLFVASDAVIGLNKFYQPFEWAGMVILSTYWLAIALLANSSYLLRKSTQEHDMVAQPDLNEKIAG